MLVWGPFEEPKSRIQVGCWGDWEPGTFWGGPPGAKAHHGRQRDALVPLRVGRLLQDLAAELEDTETGGWSSTGTLDAFRDHHTSQWPFSVTLATLWAGRKAQALCSGFRHRNLCRDKKLHGQSD